MIDFNFWPFHKHEYEIIRWRVTTFPNWVVRLKCATCGKEKNHFPKVERNESWEKENRHLQGFWNGDELYLDPTINEKTEPTQSTQDLLWLWIYTQNMEHDAMLEENVDEFKRGYVEAMEDVRWGIEFIDNFNNKELGE